MDSASLLWILKDSAPPTSTLNGIVEVVDFASFRNGRTIEIESFMVEFSVKKLTGLFV